MSFIENNQPRPGDTEALLLHKIANILLGGLSGGGAVTGKVAINDGTNPALEAVVTNAAPGLNDYGLVVRVAGDTGGAITIADGADVALGARADAAVFNPASSASLIALTKGSITVLLTSQTTLASISDDTLNLATALGLQGDAANLNPAASATVNSNIKGILSLITTGNSSLSSVVSNTGTIATNTSNINGKLGSLGQKNMAGSAPVVIASDQAAFPVTISGTPSFSGNVTQWNSNTVDTNSGVKSAGTLRVVIATDQPAFTTEVPVNLMRIQGTNLAVNTGNASAGVQRVVLATDQPSFTNPVPIKPGSGTLTDRSGTITAGATAQALAASNSSRKYLIIQNNSAESLWVNFTTTAVQSQPSLQLLPNGSLVMESGYISTEAVSIIGATTGSAFTAKEG